MREFALSYSMHLEVTHFSPLQPSRHPPVWRLVLDHGGERESQTQGRIPTELRDRVECGHLEARWKGWSTTRERCRVKRRCLLETFQIIKCAWME